MRDTNEPAVGFNGGSGPSTRRRLGASAADTFLSSASPSRELYPENATSFGQNSRGASSICGAGDRPVRRRCLRLLLCVENVSGAGRQHGCPLRRWISGAFLSRLPPSPVENPRPRFRTAHERAYSGRARCFAYRLSCTDGAHIGERRAPIALTEG